MKIIKKVFATLIFACAFNVAANAQVADDENSVAFAGTEATEDLEEADAAMGVLNVWPKTSTIKVMVDIENTQNVAIYNVAGVKVKELQVAKGQSINIESLIPGEYTVVTDDKKKGSFIKK